jgi:Protein of unknown function (DUF2778)
MNWTFEITTGKLYDENMIYQSTGYAGGNCGKNPEGVDNPADEGIKDVGPLPEGLYTAGALVEHSHLGVDAIPLIPDPSNDMKGRGGFYLHGDTIPPGNASEGCIVQPHLQRLAWLKSGCGMRVVAQV